MSKEQKEINLQHGHQNRLVQFQMSQAMLSVQQDEEDKHSMSADSMESKNEQTESCSLSLQHRKEIQKLTF